MAEMERRRLLLETAKEILDDLYASRTREAFLAEAYRVLSQASHLLAEREVSELCDHFEKLCKTLAKTKEEGKNAEGEKVGL
jgi:hypothetical protein